MRLLLTYVPGLVTLLPTYPLALAMQTLSSFYPPERLADARRRLQELGPILLVLDNVTDTALLSPEQTDQVRVLGPHLHLLATTRLGAPEGGGI